MRFTFSLRFLWLWLNSSSEGLSRLPTPDPADLSLHEAVTANLRSGDASSRSHNGTGALTLSRKLMAKLSSPRSRPLFLSRARTISLSLSPSRYLPPPLSCLV